MGHVVVVEEIDKSFYVCKNNFTQEIHGLEKSKVYKIKVASFTSKGFSNFSDYVTVITSEDGRLLRWQRKLHDVSTISLNSTLGELPK